MFGKRTKDVLVVGAGPVGQLAALLLAERGIDVEVIDEESDGARAFSVVLHPRTLELLHEVGLSAEAIEVGQRIDRVDLYDAESFRASLELGSLRGAFPFALTLRMNDLERLLERRLGERGVHVRWRHHFAGLDPSSSPVVSEIEKVDMVTAGYPVAHQEWVIQKRFKLASAFVIGADGAHSIVRRRLDLPLTESEGRRFAVFEGRARTPMDCAVRVVFHRNTTSVFWPLPGDRWRWILELEEAPSANGRPHYKDELVPQLGGWAVRRVDREMLDTLLQLRAPWFAREHLEHEVGVEMWGERRLVEHFGADHVWLAGDAAHFSGPLACESLNVGLREARDLALRIARILRGGDGKELMAGYDADRIREWRDLVGGAASTERATSPWIAAYAARLGACVPATGRDRMDLCAQVGLSPA